MRVTRLVTWTREPGWTDKLKLSDLNRSLGFETRVLWRPHPIWDRVKRYYAVDQDPRWEIWCELQPSRHPDAKNQHADTDIQIDDKWFRKLITWAQRDERFSDIGYADLDGVTEALRMANSWRSRTFFDDKIERPGIAADERQKQERLDLIRAGASHFHGLDSPRIGRYTKSADWRWRYR